MGFYRFVLALCVYFSHCDVYVLGLNIGVVAVISFNMLTGYVMTILFGRYYEGVPLIHLFYIDRIARLFPQFIFYVLVSYGFISLLGLSNIFIRDVDAHALVLNLLMLPLAINFAILPHATILPQAWSLGLELTFYMVFPFMFLSGTRTSLAVVASLSMCVFIAAYLGLIDTDTFGYRLLPGTLFMFIIGMSFADQRFAIPHLPSVAVLVLLVLLLGMILNTEIAAKQFNKEVVIGSLIGISALLVLRNIRFSQLDAFLGNLSYGMFLNNFLLIWLWTHARGALPQSAAEHGVLIAAMIVCSFATYEIIEKPCILWRRKFRQEAN
jgi:peptidoglycan/LPS O-acetylase OafA/YrhL